ncbi:hypothetical protein N9H63_00835 [bacterium]|nr:hypothetical protein [bacterium]
MAGKKWFLIVVLLLLGLKSFGQSYQYTYTDPCTGVPNTVTISQPSGSVTLFYAGQYRTFTQVELQTGAYEAWVASINAAAPPGSNPCAGNAGAVSSNTTSTVGTNVVTTVSTISSTLSTLGGSVTTNSGGMDLSGSSSGSSSSSGNGNSSSDDDGGNDSGSNTSSGSNDSGSSSGSSTGSSGSSGGSTGSGDTGGSSGGGNTGGDTGGSSGSGDTGGGSTGGGSTGGGSTGGSGSGGNSSGGNTEGNVGSDGGSTTTGDDDSGTSMGGAVGDKDIDTESGGQSSDSDDSGGGGGKKKNGPRARKGSLIASGDMVLIRNGSDYKATGNDNFKLNLGMTYANTEQTLTAGTLLNYTTGQNEIALTVYGSWKIEESMIVGSDAFLYNIKQQTWFNTGNLMYAYKQTKYTTILFGTNYSIGRVGEENFQNWAGNMGVFSTFNGYKGISMNGMMIAMYSPYTFFYEGQWLKGGFLFVPLTSVDFKVTDTFKLNLSTSTVYLMGQGILNFQLMTGGKMLL